MKKCGNYIRQIRRHKDLTQEYMAMELGISQKAYSDLENCKVKMNINTLLKVAEILEISPSKICSLSENCTTNIHQKHKNLIEYLKQHNICIPEEYL